MTWQELIDKVDHVLDMMSVGREQVDIDFINISAIEGSNAITVDVIKRPDGRFALDVE